MRKDAVQIMWVLTFLLTGLVSGCGREQAPVLIPAVIVTSPANGATGVVLNTTVTASFSLAMAPVTINATTFTLTGPGAVAVAGTVTYAGTTATFTPTAPLAASAVYVATITTGAQSTAGIPLAANFVWSFTTGAPTVISTVPATGASAVPVNTLVSATFSEVMNAATINGATFTLTGPGATPVAGAVTYAGSTATFTPTTVLATGTLYTATITTGAQDLTGAALAANFVWTFTTAPPPTVVSTVPATGAMAVPVNTLVTATFSEAMDPATINGATFILTGPGVTPVAGAVTYAGTTATFTPTTVLAANTLFTATITTGAKDPTGAALAANYVWTFTTAPPPTVISTVPVNGAADVAVNTLVSATFSEAMDPTTINGTTFTLTGPGVTPVVGVVTYAGTTATFTPAAALAGGTLFTATITTGATDPTGNPLAANYVWTFSTTSQPSVTSTNPASAATDVPINQKITATFSEPMSPATITAAETFTVATTIGAVPVAGTVTYDAASNTAIFTPSAELAASTQFTATITTAAQDPAGNALASNYVWSFTTGTVADATAPTVLTTNPADAATNMPLNQKIAATFSEAMDPATISALGTFTVVTTVGAIPVPGAVTYDTASNTAIFTPTSNLATGTQYTATISNAATDLSGNALIAGGVPNPWTFTTVGPDITAPTVILTNPVSGATAVPISATINATFSTAMNPTTITTATFLVTVTADGTPVSGTVAYNVASQIATFTPSANLAASTQYTATISAAVQDLAGNALAPGLVPNPWMFTTGVAAGPVAPNLGTAASFGSFGGNAGITNQGINTIINGDIGTTAASTLVTGFHDAGPGCTYTETPSNIGMVNGNIDTAPPPPTVGCPSEGTAATFAIATQAASDALAAFNNLSPASRPGGTDPGAGQLGGLVLPPGIYEAAGGSFMITGSDLTLDGQGDANAIWVFQTASTLTVGAAGAPRSVILINGAQAKNVFWQVGSAATINGAGGGTMVGTIIASAGVTFSTAGNAAITTLNGRALGLNASVTMVNTVINVPAP